MSASIYYQAVKGTRLSIGAPSSFLAALGRAFQDGELRLTSADYHTLVGLQAGLESEDQRAAIGELIEAVQKHDEVRVWAEY